MRSFGPEIKICGLKTPEAVDAALDGRADFLGFVYFPASPRHIEAATARPLVARAAGRARTAVLTVDLDDVALGAFVDTVRPDFIQLHGHESPERVAAVRARFGRKVIKALGVAQRSDLERVADFAGAADYLLFDAKAPPNATRPGGNGAAFDWDILAGLALATPWLLSGGLTCDNVAEALARSGAPGVDVSSGVERVLGQKDPGLVKNFLARARGGVDS